MKRKKRSKQLILTITLVTIFSICMFLVSNNKLKYKKELNINIGDMVPTIESYVRKSTLKKVKSKNIEWQGLAIENNRVYNSGTYLGYIKFKGKNIKLILNVIDDEKPVIKGVKDIIIYQNDDVDLLKDITVNDNSNDKVSIKVEGKYNASEIGEYVLSYIAKDKSDNKTVKKFKLIVKEKEIIPLKTNTVENVSIGTTTKGYTIKRVNGIYYVNGLLIANKTYSLPSEYAPGGLLEEFSQAFEQMKNEASKEGVSLYVISGYRSYAAQSAIYNKYVNKDGVLTADTYSARAGHSEHQSGLAADINSLDQSFINTKEGKWLNENCYKYGFIIRYPKDKEEETGYMYEPWHIRYVGIEIAKDLYNNGNWLSLEKYLGITSKYN